MYSKEDAIDKVEEIIHTFYKDLAYVAPELYSDKFYLLYTRIASIIKEIDSE